MEITIFSFGGGGGGVVRVCFADICFSQVVELPLCNDGSCIYDVMQCCCCVVLFSYLWYLVEYYGVSLLLFTQGHDHFGYSRGRLLYSSEELSEIGNIQKIEPHPTAAALTAGSSRANWVD